MSENSRKLEKTFEYRRSRRADYDLLYAIYANLMPNF